MFGACQNGCVTYIYLWQAKNCVTVTNLCQILLCASQTKHFFKAAVIYSKYMLTFIFLLSPFCSGQATTADLLPQVVIKFKLIIQQYEGYGQ